MICLVIWESSKRFWLILLFCLPRDFNQSKTSDKCQIEGLPIWIGAGNDETSELNNFLVYCLECPNIDEISEILTISGVASTNFADGIAFLHH